MKYDAEIRALQASLAASQKRDRELVADASNLRATIDMLKAEIQVLTDNLADAKSETEKAIHSMETDHIFKMANMMEENERVSEEKVKIAVAQAVGFAVAAKEKEVKELTDKRLAEEQAKMQADIDRLSSNDMDDAAQIALLKQQLKEQAMAHEKAMHEAASVCQEEKQGLNAKIMQLQAELSECAQVRTKQEGTIKVHKERIKSLEDQLAEVKSKATEFETKYDDGRTQMIRMEGEQRGLRAQKKAAESAVGRSELQIKALQEEIEGLRRELEAKQGMVMTLMDKWVDKYQVSDLSPSKDRTQEVEVAWPIPTSYKPTMKGDYDSIAARHAVLLKEMEDSEKRFRQCDLCVINKTSDCNICFGTSSPRSSPRSASRSSPRSSTLPSQQGELRTDSGTARRAQGRGTRRPIREGS